MCNDISMVLFCRCECVLDVCVDLCIVFVWEVVDEVVCKSSCSCSNNFIYCCIFFFI